MEGPSRHPTSRPCRQAVTGWAVSNQVRTWGWDWAVAPRPACVCTGINSRKGPTAASQAPLQPSWARSSRAGARESPWVALRQSSVWCLGTAGPSDLGPLLAAMVNSTQPPALVRESGLPPPPAWVQCSNLRMVEKQVIPTPLKSMLATYQRSTPSPKSSVLPGARSTGFRNGILPPPLHGLPPPGKESLLCHSSWALTH